MANKELDDYKIRVVSLGFRPEADKVSNFTYMNAISWVERIDQIIFDAEVTTTDYFSSYIADDYLRLEQKIGSDYRVGIYETEEKDL